MTAKGQTQAPIPPHGTRARFLHRSQPCRSDDCPADPTCRDANNAYQREYKQRTRRNVRANRKT